MQIYYCPLVCLHLYRLRSLESREMPRKVIDLFISVDEYFTDINSIALGIILDGFMLPNCAFRRFSLALKMRSLSLSFCISLSLSLAFSLSFLNLFSHFLNFSTNFHSIPTYPRRNVCILVAHAIISPRSNKFNGRSKQIFFFLLYGPLSWNWVLFHIKLPSLRTI